MLFMKYLVPNIQSATLNNQSSAQKNQRSAPKNQRSAPNSPLSRPITPKRQHDLEVGFIIVNSQLLILN